MDHLLSPTLYFLLFFPSLHKFLLFLFVLLISLPLQLLLLFISKPLCFHMPISLLLAFLIISLVSQNLVCLNLLHSIHSILSFLDNGPSFIQRYSLKFSLNILLPFKSLEFVVILRTHHSIHSERKC